MARPETPQLHPGAHRIIRYASAEASPAIVIDHWQRLDADDPYPSFDALPVLVSLDRASREREQLDARVGDWGLWIPGDSDPAAIAEAARARSLIAIHVPKFTDGRHYSLARLLRERHGFTGELRAFGDVLPDQLLYMRRCGYDSFELRAGKSLDTGLRALAALSVRYQGSADDPRPLYRRRP